MLFCRKSQRNFFTRNFISFSHHISGCKGRETVLACKRASYAHSHGTRSQHFWDHFGQFLGPFLSMNSALNLTCIWDDILHYLTSYHFKMNFLKPQLQKFFLKRALFPTWLSTAHMHSPFPPYAATNIIITAWKGPSKGASPMCGC